MKNVSPKVTASTLAAAVVAIIVWLCALSGVDVPVEVASAITIILVAVAGYFVTDPRRS